MKRLVYCWVAVIWVAGVMCGLLVKSGLPSAASAASFRALLRERRAGLDERRLQLLQRPGDWESTYRYAAALAQFRDAERNVATEQGEQPLTWEAAQPTAEQEYLLQRLVELQHSSEQEERIQALHAHIYADPARLAAPEP